MKRKMIEKVVRIAAERNIINLNDFEIPANERQGEIIAVIQEGIEEENQRVIEALQEGFAEYLQQVPDSKVKDEDTGELRPITVQEAVDFITGEYWNVMSEIDEVVNE
ncbi:hypothetical protein [Cellulosilyticum lentocellum]|uniref:Uncharacterized protein n=1 Tax=Cellulosilyticum lentocellum (strain ATCC 49066 / DSM 5427 / NCIMB 11756 / RHM5) TaxID=642492 RepID=F2JPH1_CELLD|nr:hypothetical protein [Cellulosilyticum lentocellum]ADZ82519.1 hypothetical protein Clole_0786 [Cellulosilyticum lentocellum DSM 5427]